MSEFPSQLVWLSSCSERLESSDSTRCWSTMEDTMMLSRVICAVNKAITFTALCPPHQQSGNTVLSASSGVFTAPTDGRYLVSAVLTAQRGERVEAVLSASSRSIQKLDSAGLPSSSAALPSQGCYCSSSASLSLVVPLMRGDGLQLILNAGKLAVSNPPEVLSSFSAVLLYPNPSKR